MIPSLAVCRPSLAVFSMGPFQTTLNLAIVFAFVLAIVLTKSFFRWQRQKLWHETARIALEKGQPLPEESDDSRGRGPGCGRRRNGWEGRVFLRGLILLAVGFALYLINPPGLQRWWLLPVLIGLAQLVAGLLWYLNRKNRSAAIDDRTGSTR